MTTEKELLAAVTMDRHNDTPRLVYADWLEENGDSDRAEYLRLQCELKKTWKYDDWQLDILTRMNELEGRSRWFADVRRCTSAPAPIDMGQALSELAGKAKPAVRLHPRRGKAPVDASKLGGDFLWPVDEPWPFCHFHGCHLAPVLQLRKEDAPNVEFKPDTDLLQVFWCSFDFHETDLEWLAPRLVWRKRSDVKKKLKEQPEKPEDEWDEWIDPEPCRLYPEEVLEYPSLPELQDEWQEDFPEVRRLNETLKATKKFKEQHKLQNWSSPTEPHHAYAIWLAVAPGVKVGGYPLWLTGSRYPECFCGERTEHLVTFPSREFSSFDWGRWLPIEERFVLFEDYIGGRPDGHSNRPPTGVSATAVKSCSLFAENVPSGPFESS